MTIAMTLQQCITDGIGLIAVCNDCFITNNTNRMIDDQGMFPSLEGSNASVWMPSSVLVNTRLREFALRPMIQYTIILSLPDALRPRSNTTTGIAVGFQFFLDINDIHSDETPLFKIVKNLVNVNDATLNGQSILTKQADRFGKNFPFCLLHNTLLQNFRRVTFFNGNSLLENNRTGISFCGNKSDSGTGQLLRRIPMLFDVPLSP